MADAFQLKLVTPTGIVFEGPVVEVSATGPRGEIGVLASHINLITSLTPCLVQIKPEGGGAETWIISGGLAEVKDGVMTLLANGAERPEAVDRRAAEADEKAAEQKFSAMSFYDDQYAAAVDALDLARARTRAASLNRTER
ncbi:MAG TPA: ATP synthase F1 subunit epsilon [Candidatus Binataceae bacterium]|nr:ATP synthase F1 subunit epsilon [Candidatus Binataceae bacterium]